MTNRRMEHLDYASKVDNLTISNLDELIYRASVSANARLFKGIVPLLDNLNEKLDSILEEVEYLKSSSNYKAHIKLEEKLSLREQQISEVVQILKCDKNDVV